VDCFETVSVNVSGVKFLRKVKSEMRRGLFGAFCVGVFATYAFTSSGNTESPRAVPTIQTSKIKPTARDLIVFDRRLRKATRDSRYAAKCAQGQFLGGTEIHVAMNFPKVGQRVTDEQPSFAQARIEKLSGTPKVLVLEAKDPTLWSVTGAPSAIFLLGESVIADFPEGVPVFAPRYAESCRRIAPKLPQNWTFPVDQKVIESLADDLGARFDQRAQTVSNRLFNRRATNWKVQRGDTIMSF